MLVHKRMRRPALECLEARWVPATIKLFSGSLFISNQVGALTVTATATPGKFDVTDNGKTVTVSGVGSLISITGTNAANKVTFDLAGNKFGGNVLVNTGNGNDSIAFTGTGPSNVIGGNITLLTGYGDDTVRLNATAGPGMRVGGSVVGVNTLGRDSFTMGNTDDVTKIGRNLSLYNYANRPGQPAVALGAGGRRDVIGGDVTISSPLVSTGVGVIVGELLGSGGNVQVGGNLTMNTGAGMDGIFFRGLQFTKVGTTIGGDTTLRLGDGYNDFSTALANGTRFNGNFTYVGGSGQDNVLFWGEVQGSGFGVQVLGDTYIDYGEGDNDLMGLGFYEPVFHGDVTVRAGNGNNFATPLIPGDEVAHFGGTVHGDLTMIFGNGDNFSAADPFEVVRAPGGTFTLRTGNGTNFFGLDSTQVFGFEQEDFRVDVVMGNGNNTFILNWIPPANPPVPVTGRVSGRIVGGLPGANTFTVVGTWTIMPDFQLINFS